MMMKKIVVASDSFKGSLSSAQVAECAEKGILSVYPDCLVVKVSVADGGEGTVDALIDALSGQKVEVEVSDPLGRKIRSSYGIFNSQEGIPVAVLEMSSASGLPLLAVSERNPWQTSTLGTGEMIMDAIGKGCRKFLIGIGGSATNDAGTGMLSALGFRFLDKQGQEVFPCGGNLGEIACVDSSLVPSAVLESEFVVACDVDTPFCGPVGAAYVFAPQKGADSQMVERLDRGMASFASVVEKYLCEDSSLFAGSSDRQDLSHEFRTRPGTGAAGGLGGGFLAFLNARLERGADMVLDAINFDEHIAGADLVITGEGKIDFQTSKGKTPHGVMARAARQHIPTIAIGGAVELVEDSFAEQAESSVFAAAFPIVSGPVDLEEAMKPSVAARNVQATVARIMNLIKRLKQDE